MAEDRERRTNGFVQWRHAATQLWLYCPLCRNELTERKWDGKPRRYCVQCGFVYWERPLPATAAILYDSSQHQILLVTRRYPPEAGGLTFPGGGIESGESVDEALIREVKEETGLDVTLDHQLGTWSTPNKETLITFFVAHATGGIPRAGSDALSADWVALDRAPKLAFSLHQEVLELFRHYVRLGKFR